MKIDANTPAWQLSASMYCTQQNVTEPYVAEISPMQYGLMSKRAKGQYDDRRRQEWQAAADCKAEWRRKVLEAHKAGVFDWRNPPTGAHREAVEVCRFAELMEKAQNKFQAFTEYIAANRLTSTQGIKPADRIFDVLYSGYVTVLKVNGKSLRVQLERDGAKAKPYTADARRFYRLSYSDAEVAFEEAYKAAQ